MEKYSFTIIDIVLLIVTIILFVLATIKVANSQTLEERLTSLESRADVVDSILGISQPIIIDTTLPKPIYEGIVMQSFTQDNFIFNPALMVNGNYVTFTNNNGVINLVKSVNGLNSWTFQSTNAHYGSFLYVSGQFKGSYDKWFDYKPWSYFENSNNGITFNDVALYRTTSVGEDRTLLMNGNEYWLYVRMRPHPRTIGFQKSINFTSWTYPVEILSPDAQDINKQFYSMSVVKTTQGYFGLLNVYRVGSAGQDVDQQPPYTAQEHTIDVQLVWSADGITNWQRLNNRKPFIERPAGIMQMFTTASIIGDQVIIYTIQSRRRHTDWENIHNVAGNYYHSARYKISLTNLYKYKN